MKMEGWESNNLLGILMSLSSKPSSGGGVRMGEEKKKRDDRGGIRGREEKGGRG